MVSIETRKTVWTNRKAEDTGWERCKVIYGMDRLVVSLITMTWKDVE